MNAASSEAKNTAAVATSDGNDKRPSGMVAMNCARLSGVSSPMKSASMAVSPATGLMMLTRMLSRASSGRRAGRIGGFASVRLMDIVDDDTRAFGGEARGDAATESGAGARHDGDFVGEPHDQSCRTTTVFSVVNPYSASKPFSRPYP